MRDLDVTDLGCQATGLFQVETDKGRHLRSLESITVHIDIQRSRKRLVTTIANRLLRRVRDYAQVRAEGAVTHEVSLAALELLEVDANGFDEADRRLLRTIIDKFGGGPVGLNSMAAAIGEEKDAIEDIHEPFLIQIGFLHRTPRGRVATPRAYQYFGLPAPAPDGRLW
ncbi:MAG: hypothetical protein CL483_13780 [Acidobacteria bacterium]|nr:hypothetical protein [Acidobacteriota bacterium]